MYSCQLPNSILQLMMPVAQHQAPKPAATKVRLHTFSRNCKRSATASRSLSAKIGSWATSRDRPVHHTVSYSVSSRYRGTGHLKIWIITRTAGRTPEDAHGLDGQLVRWKQGAPLYVGTTTTEGTGSGHESPSPTDSRWTVTAKSRYEQTANGLAWPWGPVRGGWDAPVSKERTDEPEQME